MAHLHYTESVKNKAVQALRAGTSIAEVSQRFGIPTSAVGYWKRHIVQGIPHRKKGKFLGARRQLTAVEREQLEKKGLEMMLKQGMTASKVAAILHVAESTPYRWLEKHGLNTESINQSSEPKNGDVETMTVEENGDKTVSALPSPEELPANVSEWNQAADILRLTKELEKMSARYRKAMNMLGQMVTIMLDDYANGEMDAGKEDT